MTILLESNEAVVAAVPAANSGSMQATRLPLQSMEGGALRRLLKGGTEDAICAGSRSSPLHCWLYQRPGALRWRAPCFEVNSPTS
jgi:hypothetical protein